MSITVNNNADEIDSKRDLLKRTICKGATDDELDLFSAVCKRTGLDPFISKQIHPIHRWDSKLGRNVMTMQTSIDGYRLIAERTGNYCPGREPTYQYDENKRIVSATAYVKKRTSDGTWHEVAATAYYQEYVQRLKDGSPSKFWSQMSHLMIAKCAEALALRRSFPAELSGIYTADEMSQAENTHSTASLIEVEKVLESPQIENQSISEEKSAQLDLLFQEINDQDFINKLTSYGKTAYGCDTLYEVNDSQFDKIVTRLNKEIAKRKEEANGSNEMARMA